jgi:hypothetical protein
MCFTDTYWFFLRCFIKDMLYQTHFVIHGEIFQIEFNKHHHNLNVYNTSKEVVIWEDNALLTAVVFITFKS